MMRRLFLLGVVGAILTAPFFVHAEHDKESESLYQAVESHSLALIAWEEEDWSEVSYYEYLKRSLEYQRNPQEFKKRRSAFKLLSSLEAKTDQVPRRVLADTTTWTDLNLFSGTHDPAACLVDKINRSRTHLGRAQLCCMLAQPQTDIQELRRRQRIIKELLENPILCEQLDEALTRLSAAENLMLSFWLQQDALDQAAKRHYFNVAGFDSFNNALNKNEAALAAGMLWEHYWNVTHACSAAIATVLLPLYALTRILDKQLPQDVEEWAKSLRRGGTVAFLTKKYLDLTRNPKIIRAGENGEIVGDGLLYGMGLKGHCEWIHCNIMLDVLLQEKLIGVASYIDALHDVEAIIATSDTLAASLPSAAKLQHLVHEIPQESETVAQLFELLRTNTFTGKASLFSHHGRVLAAYRLVPMVKDMLAPACAALAEVDVYVGMAKLVREFQLQRVTYCFADFKESATPSIAIQNFWNPFVDATKVVPNSILLDGGNRGANAIVTGPNAGGKSTILKSIALNLILAQTFGICPASAASVTPFSSITTYLNIADDIASGNSLFKAEVLRAQTLIKKVEGLQAGEFSFVAIDEMFSGTSPREGRAAAYSVAKHLGKFNNNISMIATHFPLLTNLASDTPYFANYKVTVNVAPDGTITYPFKLEPGVSDQHVAIDILKAEGFDNQILADALNLVHTAQE